MRSSLDSLKHEWMVSHEENRLEPGLVLSQA